MGRPDAGREVPVGLARVCQSNCAGPDPDEMITVIYGTDILRDTLKDQNKLVKFPLDGV